MVPGNDPIVDLFDFLWGEPGTDGFDYVLIVPLAIKATVDGFIVYTPNECLVIVVDDREVLGFVIFEYYYPVMSENFAVIGY